MSTLSLSLVFSCFQLGSRHRLLWPFLLGLGAFSLEMQAATLLGWGGLRSLGLVNVGALGILLCFRERRASCSAFLQGLRASLGRRRQLMRGAWPQSHGWLNRTAIVLALALAGVVVMRAAFYELEAVDPYHLMKVYHIDRTGTLEYVPCYDFKINVLGFLYELLLADLKSVPLFGALLFSIAQIGMWLAFFFLITGIFIPVDPDGRRFAAWSFVLFTPLLFAQFLLVKNDAFGALFGFGALLLTYEFEESSGAEDALLIGALCGFAMGVKAANFPLIAAAGLLLPWKSLRTFFWSRGLCGVAFVSALVAGGFFYTLGMNSAVYGEIFGPMSQTGNSTSSLTEAALSSGRFLLSLFDLGLVTPRLWPGRGGWGGNVGLAFWISMAIAVDLWRRRRLSPRLAVLGLVSVLLFSATYPDADIAHRMALAPLLLWIVVPVRAVLSEETRSAAAFRWVMAGATLLLALASLRVGGAQLRHVELLRPQSLLRAPLLRANVKPKVYDRPSWRMRAVNEEARARGSALSLGQENYLMLRDVPYRPLAVVSKKAEGNGYRLEWSEDALARGGFLVVDPLNAPLSSPRWSEIHAVLPLESQIGATETLPRGVLLPPRRPSGPERAPFSRPPALMRPKPGAERRQPSRRHADHRAQDDLRVPALPDRRRKGPPRGTGTDAGDDQGPRARP